MNGKRTTGRYGKARLALLAACLLLCGAAYGAELAERIEETKATLEEWVATQQVISKEKRDLALKREMLSERIALVRQETDSLREKIADIKAGISKADETRAEKEQENERLKEATQSLADILSSLEKRTLDLLKRVPDPICDKVRPLSQMIPEGSEESELSVSQRFQNVVGILNELNKANREITLVSEVRELPDGTSAEVTALYIGISQGYYSGVGGAIAGVGRPTEEGWEWVHANNAAERIKTAIDILNNEKVASFVQLPLEIH